MSLEIGIAVSAGLVLALGIAFFWGGKKAMEALFGDPDTYDEDR